MKPFVGGLLLAVALLFGQAMCDLNLPSFMSDIINVGIQQNGIEHAAPEALSEQSMQLMRALMSEDDKNLVDSHYSLVSADTQNDKGKTYDSVYPAAKDRSLYVRAGTDKDSLTALDNAFGTAAWTLITMMQEQAKPDAAPADNAAEGDGPMTTKIDMAQVQQVAPLLGQMPPQELQRLRDKAMETDALLRRQSGAVFAEGMFTELGGDLAAQQTGYILRIGLLMLLVALAGGVATVLVSLLSSKISSGVARNVRSAIFGKVSSFSNTEFDKFSTASLITRTTNDITQIQMVLMLGIRMLCYSPIMAVGGVIMAVQKSASMAWIIAAACAFLLGLMLVVLTVAMPKFKIMQKLVDKLNLVSRENLSGLMVIRAFGTQEHETKRFAAANQDLAKTGLFINRVFVVMMPLMMLVMNGISLLIVWTGSHQIAESAIQVGDMMAFMQYAMQVIMSFLMISMMFIFVPRAAVAAARIAEVLETVPSIVDPKTPKPFDSKKRGLVEFKGVNFRYGGAEEDALHDISFTASPGETTAFIGSTGSGKSTVANLLLRFYDVTAGEILVDGADVREVRQNDLRARIGYVPQKGVLLSGTVGSNLRYGAPDASDDEVIAAATVAQAMEFISANEARLDADIAQGGTNVSGGQKQRLSIARALTKNPEIFIFDDSFSALDFKTDRALRTALRENTGGSTVLIVAQRVSTIMDAEQIIVLDEGKIVGRGTHRELLKSCPQYFEIASSQLSKEELA